MSNSRPFVGRARETAQLRRAYAESRHVLIVGSPGIGKTALLRHVRQYSSFLLCEETSSLGRICDSLERQLGWTHRQMTVVERKNRLLCYLSRRAEPIALDAVALTPPRVARFIASLSSCVSVWIGCRSARPKDIGAVWQNLYRFERLDLGPLAPNETATFVEAAVNSGRLPQMSRNQISRLHRLAKGNPRVLEELLIELASREYQLDELFDRKLLDLDRRIHNATDVAAAQSAGKNTERFT